MSFKSLKTKITAQFGLILVLTCGVIFAGIMMLRMIKGSMEKVEADTPEFVQSLELNKNMLLAMYHMEYYMATESNAEAEKAVACFGDVQKNLTALVGMKFNDPIIDSIVATMQNFQPAVELSEKCRAELAVHHKSLEKTKLHRGISRLLSHACGVQTQCYKNEQLRTENRGVFRKIARPQHAGQFYQFLTCGQHSMTRTTTAPIEHAVEGITRIADGDLTHKVKVESDDELGNMAEKLNDMTGQLRMVVDNIVTGSNNIYQGATEMSQTSQLMSDGANRQAASAEEVSSSVEQMAASVSQNSDNARATEKIAQNALLSIRKGTEASTQSMAAMKEIAEKNLNC